MFPFTLSFTIESADPEGLFKRLKEEFKKRKYSFTRFDERTFEFHNPARFYRTFNLDTGIHVRVRREGKGDLVLYKFRVCEPAKIGVFLFISIALFVTLSVQFIQSGFEKWYLPFIFLGVVLVTAFIMVLSTFISFLRIKYLIKTLKW